jgi:hypothetical protein
MKEDYNDKKLLFYRHLNSKQKFQIPINKI